MIETRIVKRTHRVNGFIYMAHQSIYVVQQRKGLIFKKWVDLMPFDLLPLAEIYRIDYEELRASPKGIDEVVS